MRTNPKYTNQTENKTGRWTHPSLIKTSYNKNHKILTQQSPAHQQPFLSAATITKNYANCYSNIFNEVTTSEVFVSVGLQPKQQQNSQKQSKASNKYILRNYNTKEQFANSDDNKSDIFCKRSIQILIDIKPPMMETKYQKISRRKEQFLKRSTINGSETSNNNQIMQKMAKKIENPHSQQKLIDKYRELLQVKEKQPFNMINKLYQIDLLTAKEAVFCPKEVFKAATTKTNFKKKRSNIEIKNKQYWQKSKQSNYHNIDVIYGESSPFNGKQLDKSSTLNSFNPLRKPNTQQKYKQARQMRQIVSKNAKTTQQTPTNQTITSPVRINQFKSNKYGHKKSEYQSLKTQSNTKNQNLIVVSLPKKISSTAFIIYEVIQDKNKTNPRKVQIQSKKKRQMNSRIHASYNIKSASEIASLTKIMTCVIVVQICEKLAINPQQQKYKIGVYQSTIRGTTADIQTGQIYTIHQLLHGLMLPSGNDASIALARWGGNVLLLSDNEGQKRKAIQKSEKGLINSHWLVNNKFLRYKEQKFKFRRCYNRFLAEMNKKARVLGLDRTNYVNSHGLSNPHNKSCCLDLAILCEYAMQNGYFRSIVGCKQYQGMIEQCMESITSRNPKKRKESSANLKIDQDPEQMNLLQDLQDELEFNNESEDEDQTQSDSLGCSNNKKQKEIPQEQRQISFVEKQIKWENTHRLLHKKDCYVGIKTGVTATAGACLASYVTIQDRSFIIIVLNSKKLSLRFADTELLRKWLIKKQNLAQSVARLECDSEINANE